MKRLYVLAASWVGIALVALSLLVEKLGFQPV